MDRFMSGLEKMMNGPPEEAADDSVAQRTGDSKDLDGFRSSLIQQTRCCISLQSSTMPANTSVNRLLFAQPTPLTSRPDSSRLTYII